MTTEKLSQTGAFETSKASKYIQQLCKHFAHKVAVEYGTLGGIADLPPGKATMVATDTQLTITVTGQTDEALAKARYIIDSHLERFAFRESYREMNWGEAQPCD